MLVPIEIAPNTNLVDFSAKPKPSRDVKIVVNDFTNNASKFKKLSPKIYKVK